MNKFILLSISSLCFTFSAYAGGFKIGLQGLKQIGMGHTGVGFVQDAATIYFNPAGMSFIGNQVNIGCNALMPNTSFLETNTNLLTKADAQVFTPFSVYASSKLYKKFNIGLGIYTPFGSGMTYPKDWGGEYILHKINLSTIYFQPTLSYKISKKLAVGAGFVYSTGHVTLEKDLPINSMSNSTIASAQLKGAASGIGYNAGAYLHFNEQLSFGLTYHSKVLMKVKEGTANFKDIPTALTASFPATNTFTTTLALPSELSLGVAYRLADHVIFALDLNRTFWNSYDSLGFDYGVNTDKVTDAKSPRNYQDVSAIRVGVQYEMSSKFVFRTGFFYDQTPVKDGYVAPELPDNNKIGFTLGASVQVAKNVKLDFSFLYESVPNRKQTNLETGLSGTFQTKAIAPGIGIQYQFNKKNNPKK